MGHPPWRARLSLPLLLIWRPGRGVRWFLRGSDLFAWGFGGGAFALIVFVGGCYDFRGRQVSRFSVGRRIVGIRLRDCSRSWLSSVKALRRRRTVQRRCGLGISATARDYQVCSASADAKEPQPSHDDLLGSSSPKHEFGKCSSGRIVAASGGSPPPRHVHSH